MTFKETVITKELTMKYPYIDKMLKVKKTLPWAKPLMNSFLHRLGAGKELTTAQKKWVTLLYMDAIVRDDIDYQIELQEKLAILMSCSLSWKDKFKVSSLFSRGKAYTAPQKEYIEKLVYRYRNQIETKDIDSVKARFEDKLWKK